MANLDHNAIRKAYSEVTTIQDSQGAFDKNGNPVTLEQSKIDAARAAIDAEYAALEYSRKRAEEYPDWRTQLDYIYPNGVDKGKTDIVDPVKSTYPKPECH